LPLHIARMGNCTCKHGEHNKDDELFPPKEAPKEAPLGSCAETFKGMDLSLGYELAQVLQLDVPFVAVNLNTFDPFKDQLALTASGREHLDRVAGLLKKSPDSCIRVFGFTAPPSNANDVILALAQARFVRDELQKQGCRNGIAVKGVGLLDSKGHRCELAMCSLEEVNQMEKEVAQMENSFDFRLAKVLKLDLDFEPVDLQKFNLDTCEFRPQALENLKKIADVLRESPSTCVRVFGYTGPPNHEGCVRLSLARTHRVRDALFEHGCTNRIVTKGCGYADDRGPRCELAVCKPEEADAIEYDLARGDPQGEWKVLDILFLHQGKEVPISLTQRPMGLTFTDDTLPVRITKLTAGGHAATCGVKLGMEVKAVNGESVAGMKFPEIHEKLRRATMSLPYE